MGIVKGLQLVPVADDVHGFRSECGGTVGRDQQHVGAVLGGQPRQHRLPRVVADQGGHPAEAGVVRAHRLTGAGVLAFLPDRIVRQVQLAVGVEQFTRGEVGGRVVGAQAAVLVETDHDVRPGF